MEGWTTRHGDPGASTGTGQRRKAEDALSVPYAAGCLATPTERYALLNFINGQPLVFCFSGRPVHRRHQPRPVVAVKIEENGVELTD